MKNIAKAKTNKQQKNVVQKKKPNKDSPAQVEVKKVEANSKVTKKNNMPLGTKNVVANGKVNKKNVVPLAKPTASSVANGKIIKKNVLPQAKAEANNMVVNSKTAKKNAMPQVVNKKITKKNVMPTSKMVPPKKLITKEESDIEEDEDDDNSESDEFELNLDQEQAVDGSDDDDEDDNNDEVEDNEDDDEVEDNQDDDEVEDDEVEVDDDEVEDDDDEDNDDNAEDNDDEDDDDAIEEDIDDSVQKKTPKKKGFPLINFKSIPPDTPVNQVLFIKNLPNGKSFTHEDIAEVFFKYGTILSIVIRPGSKASTASVAFDTAAAAKAALKENKKAKIKNCIIDVSIQRASKKEVVDVNKKDLDESKKRTIFVGNITETTEDDLRTHFESCGNIIKVFILERPYKTHAFVEFENEDAIEKALKLNGSTLNGSKINVKPNNKKRLQAMEQVPELTIVVQNTNSYDTYPEAKLREIFGKCGHIRHIDLVCLARVLAFITFDKPGDVDNALKLSGTKVDDLDIEVAPYEVVKSDKQLIFIKNVLNDVTNDEIIHHFKDIGPIISVKRKPKVAIVKFKTTEAFCKSFLLDESFLGGMPIFIQPYSFKRDQFLKKLKKRYPRPTTPADKSPDNAVKRPHSEKSPDNAVKRPNSEKSADNAVKRPHSDKQRTPHFFKKGGPPNKRVKGST